jgi:hypothetical protein
MSLLFYYVLTCLEKRLYLLSVILCSGQIVSNPNKTSVTSRRRVVQHVRGGKGWLRQKNKKEKRKEQQEEIRIRREIKECEADAAREAERERKRERERARRAKEAGLDAVRKGKYPRCTQ